MHDVWPSTGLLHEIYTFGGSCPLTEFCHVQNARYVQFLRSPILAALLHALQQRASAKLCGVEHRAPPIFGRAAITLGIGPHSSFHSNAVSVLCQNDSRFILMLYDSLNLVTNAFSSGLMGTWFRRKLSRQCRTSWTVLLAPCMCTCALSY